MSFRIEQKIFASEDSLPRIYSWFSESGAVQLHAKRQINSVYFDSEEKLSYQHSIEGIVPRKKIRVRCYGNCTHETGPHVLETKISSLEGRFKLSDKCEDFEKKFGKGIIDNFYGFVEPVVQISYKRSYFDIKGVRFTLDTDLKYSEFHFNNRDSFAASHRDYRIALEIKSNNLEMANFIEDQFQFPRTQFSKYIFAIQALELTNCYL